MTTKMERQGEPQGMLGWPKNPRSLTNQNLRLCVKCDARGSSQLNLSHRGLNHIPQQVFQFQQLDILNMSHNNLDQLPPMISYLRGLRALHLAHNALTTLPPTLVNCRHLSELDLSHNRLVALPKGVGGLRSLKILKLGDNQLEQVPHELGSLTNLRVMDLHGNRLWYVPYSFQNLYRLLRLDLSNNLFDQVPMVVTHLTWLRALNLSKNRLAVLPPDFDQLRQLRELNLSENHFVALGVMATRLRQLKYLSLSHNRLQLLPDQVSHLKNLRVLHLKDNALQALPENFMHLKYLNVAENKLKEISALHMNELVALDASGNFLETLPRGVFKLKHLQRLCLARNKIQDVPEDIGWLKKLQSLDLSENDLRSLPSSLHFLEKLTSFNIRGNHKLSRIPLTSPIGPNEDELKILKTKSQPASRKSVKEAEKLKRRRTKLLRQYSSMPSLQHPTSSKKDIRRSQSVSKSKHSSDWPQQGEPTWLDNFLLSKPQRRASWDANMTLRTARSIPYPIDERYDTGEIHANFLAESFSDDDDNKNIQYFHPDPLKSMALNFDHDDENNDNNDDNDDDDDDDEDSALEASFTSSDFNQKGSHYPPEEDGGFSWSPDRTIPKTTTSSSNKNKRNLKKPTKNIITSGKNKSANNDIDNQTYKKTPFNNNYAATQSRKNEKSEKKSTNRHSDSYDFSDRKPPENHPNNPETYNHHHHTNSEVESSWDPARHMNVLMTSNGSRPNSQPSTIRRGHNPKSPHLQQKKGGSQVQRSEGNWMMVRSQVEDKPLTVQTWTQTQPLDEESGSHAGTHCFTPHGSYYGFSGLRSPDSPPMLASMADKRRGQLDTNQSSVGSPALFGSSPAQSSSLVAQTLGKGANFWSGTLAGSEMIHTEQSTKVGGHMKSNTTDYTLLGVCNQIQTLLHKDLLQPVIGYNGHPRGRFSNKTIKKGENGAWHLGGWNQQSSAQEAWPELERAESSIEAGLEYSPGETFTTTERGGHYASAFCPHVQVSVPPGAVDRTLHVTLQQLTISSNLLKTISEADGYVANLISIGPVVFLNALENVTFASPVTLTLPAPTKVKGHGGHMVVVSVRGDGVCVPCTTAYQSSRNEVTLTTWHMTGKVAVLSKARCKYKACKSVEQLLTTLNLLAVKVNQLEHQ